jgi:hypothetical protein
MGARHAECFITPIWLRNPHVQSVLGSSSWRKKRGAQALRATGAVTSEYLLDGGNGLASQAMLADDTGILSRPFPVWAPDYRVPDHTQQVL